MADAARDKQDQSMEEILHSIKRIIAEENDDVGGVVEQGTAGGAKGSDVLELTDVVEKGNVPERKPAPVMEKPMETAPRAAASPSHDILSNIDTLLSNEAAQSAASSLRSLASKPQMAPIASVPSPHFRSGNTVEDLVLESLRPMLKEWLDANLPGMVERLVEREIKRVSSSM